MISALTIHRENELKETLYDVAQRFGCSISHLSNIESGKAEPPMHGRQKLAEAYRLTMASLLEKTGWNAGGKTNGNRQHEVCGLPRVSAVGVEAQSKRPRQKVRKASSASGPSRKRQASR